MAEILTEAGSIAAEYAQRTWRGWRRIGLWVDGDEGLNNDSGPLLEVELFRDVGELGLECFVGNMVDTRQMTDLLLSALLRHARGQLPQCKRCQAGQLG